jgi:hypothetical protein
VNSATASGGSASIGKYACDQTWAVASGTTTFPPGGSPPENFVVLFQYANGAWSVLNGPDDGTCIAAEASSAPCSDGAAGPLVSIPSSVLTQMVQQAGLTLAPDGSIS